MLDAAALEALGINAAEGLAYCADDAEFYHEMIGEYVNESGDNLARMRQFFEDRDWTNYRIRVHSLKNTSRMIGAEALSERAYTLETAAKEQDESVLMAEHAPFLADYGALIDALRRLYG